MNRFRPVLSYERRRSAMSRSAPCAVALTASLVVLAAVVGCQSYGSPHGVQNTRPITRLDTIPRGARVHIERFNMRLGKATPVDLPAELGSKDVVSVTLDGYRSWKGSLGEIPVSARGTHELVLEPLAPVD